MFGSVFRFHSRQQCIVCLPTLTFALASSSVSMTRTLIVEAWLDNILSSAWSSDVTSIAPLTPPLTEIETETTTNIPSQFQHCGKRKRSLELEQPKNPELNQQQYSEHARRPNKQPRIEPFSQLTRLNLRRAIMSQTPVYAQV